MFSAQGNARYLWLSYVAETARGVSNIAVLVRMLPPLRCLADAAEVAVMSPTDLVRVFRNTCGTALVVIAIFTAGANAQRLHDFGGTWVVIESPPGALAVGDTQIVTVAADDPSMQISIERHVEGTVSIDSYSLSVFGGVDGRETTVTTSARWIQNALVMTKETYFKAIDAKPFLSRHEERWSIGDHGQLRIRMMDQDDNLERRISELVCEQQR